MYLSPVYTAAPAVADERVGAVFAALDSLGIPYIRFEHDATATMEDCAAVGKALEGTICKNLFLCNRQQTAFYLLTMPGDKPFHTKDLSAQIGSSRLSFAPPEKMEELLNTHPGSASVMGLLFSRMSESARAVRKQDALATALHADLTEFKERLAAEPAQEVLEDLVRRRQAEMKRAREAGQLDKERRELDQREIQALETYRMNLSKEDITAGDAVMEAVKGWFAGEVEQRRTLGAETSAQFDNAFRFLEQAFGQGQELVIFVTEVTAGYDASWCVENFGCDAYFRHNRELLFDDTRHRIREEIQAARAAGSEEDKRDE